MTLPPRTNKASGENAADDAGGSGVSGGSLSVPAPEASELTAGTDDTASPADAFRCVLPNFEGPLDLLLHLISEHKVDILDIPIALITEKYLETLRLMRDLDLDIAGEFLLMAATLAHIKSRILLPQALPDDEEEELQTDPREELVRRLLEYQKYKAAAESLGERPILGKSVFTRKARTILDRSGEDEAVLAEVPVFRLVELLAKVLKNKTPDPFHEVHLENFNLTETMDRIVSLLRRSPRTSFLTLLGGSHDRGSILMTFLAILEMCKMRLLRLVQAEGSDDIYITAPHPDSLARAVSLFKDDYQ